MSVRPSTTPPTITSHETRTCLKCGATYAPGFPHDCDSLAKSAALTEPIDWQKIANELAAEVTRLHDEIDRMHRGPVGDPPALTGHMDRDHPLARLWFELRLDDQETHDTAWTRVTEGRCGACDGALTPGPYRPFAGRCEDCNLAWIADPRSLGLDQIDRAIDRGPDE